MAIKINGNLWTTLGHLGDVGLKTVLALVMIGWLAYEKLDGIQDNHLAIAQVSAEAADAHAEMEKDWQVEQKHTNNAVKELKTSVDNFKREQGQFNNEMLRGLGRIEGALGTTP